MLKIKLTRIGRKNQPYYRVVVSEEHSKSGKSIAILGSYNPHDLQNKLTIDKDRYTEWLKKGAQPTNTVRLLVDKQK